MARGLPVCWVMRRLSLLAGVCFQSSRGLLVRARRCWRLLHLVRVGRRFLRRLWHGLLRLRCARRLETYWCSCPELVRYGVCSHCSNREGLILPYECFPSLVSCRVTI